MIRSMILSTALLLVAGCSSVGVGTGDASGAQDVSWGDTGVEDVVASDAPSKSDVRADLPCVADCTNRRCGDDGCGGSCGTCPYPDAHLECVDGKCLPPMVDIPAGTFWMGCNEAADGECEADEKPYHQVTLSAYRIDKYEVTAGAYREYLAAVGPGCTNPGDGQACWPEKDGEDDRLNVNVEGRETYPANGPGWYQSDGYCRWAGRSLCTEAQWEYAARGSDGRKYPWGNDCPASWGDKCEGPEWTKSTAKANCIETYCHDGYPSENDGCSPVGVFSSGVSPFGVMDMVGNVSEYVKDWYASDYFCKGPYADVSGDLNPCLSDSPPFQVPWKDPQGPSEGLRPVIRGGDQYSPVDACFSYFLRASDRQKGSLKPICVLTGFRCCSSL